MNQTFTRYRDRPWSVNRSKGVHRTLRTQTSTSLYVIWSAFGIPKDSLSPFVDCVSVVLQRHVKKVLLCLTHLSPRLDSPPYPGCGHVGAASFEAQATRLLPALLPPDQGQWHTVFPIRRRIVGMWHSTKEKRG